MGKALDNLSPKRRAFVLAYTGEAQGNAAEAARIAGYKHPRRQGHRLLTFVDVGQAVKEIGQKVESDAILTRRQRQELLTAIALGQEPDTYLVGGEFMEGSPRQRDRLKAIELLGKMQGDFIDRVEHTGNVGAQLVIVDNGRGPMPEEE